MLHLTRRRRRCLIALSVLLALLGSQAPPDGGSVALAAVGIAASPSALSVSVPLGQVAAKSITITNTSNQPLTPSLYEAYPKPPTALARGPVAPELRAVALPRQADRVDAQLRTALQAAPDGRADFLIYLRGQADLSAAYAIGDWAERGRYVYRTLFDYAEGSQRGLRGQLAARGLRYRPLWIVNAVLAHGSEADAQALVARADVALVRANHVTALPPTAQADTAATDTCSPDSPGNPVCWNIRKIGADRVWRDFGVTGQGVVVANIDTGVAYTHPALAARYRGYLAPGRYDHNYNWFSLSGSLAAPADSDIHGTHTMGTMIAAGNGTVDQPAVGVAPGARWVAAQGCSAFACTEADLIAAAQWMLAPTDLVGTRPRPDLRPMIVNNSWAGGSGDNWYSGYTAAWRAAGIFPVFAAGNDGYRGCGSIDSPGDYANVAGIGATNQNDLIAPFSSRGPALDGRRKPDFVAPGQMIFSTTVGDGAAYRTLQGTSMATPHVAGTVALLWSANPALIGDYDTTYAIIRDTAHGISDTQCGDKPGGPNNVYGYGRIDAYAAVARAHIDVPWLETPAAPQQLAANSTASLDVTLDAAKVPGPGIYRARIQLFGADLSQPPTTIDVAMTVTPVAQQATVTGRVISADTGAPVAATVGAKDGLGMATDSTGTYTLTLAAGSYELIAIAPAFLPASLRIALDADKHAPDIIMQPDQPHITAPATGLSATLEFGQRKQLVVPIGNTGTRPLYYQIHLLADRFAVLRSDQAGGPGYAWVDLPSNATRLTLTDNSYKDDVPLGMEFPFYSYTLTQTLVTSNGTLAFSAPNGPYNGLSSLCMPDLETYFYVIAPLRADLDPSRGGVVRYGTVNGGRTFVLSYQGVPLHAGPAGQTYTFQVLLHDNGRIVYQYQKLGVLPSRLSVGVQRTVLDYQELGCGAATPLHDGLAIELRPQPATTLWLDTQVEGGVLLPSSQRPITTTLDWVRPGDLPLQGRVEITSNDPLRGRVIVPLSITMKSAPHEVRLLLLGESNR